MSIQANFPAIKPTLLLDFANTEALDPRITFTRASTGTYYDAFGVLLTAASGVPRFDHNPITGESLGLLVEEQRTNLLLQSETFDNASWVKTNVTVTANATVSPDGTADADKLIATAVSGVHRTYQTVSKTAAAQTLTFSCYMKAAGYGFALIRLFDSTEADNASCAVNLSTGEILTAAAGFTGVSGAAVNVGNSWWRVSITATTDAETSVNSAIFIQPSLSTSAGSFTGNGTDGLFLWGAQLEAGSFPTSYIPTVASQVTRAADSASMTGTNFSSWYNQSEGTLYADATAAALSSTAGNPGTFVGISDGTVSNRLRLKSENGTAWEGAVAGTSQFAIGTYGSAGVSYKLAGAYKVNDFAYSFNGTTAATDTLGTVPVVSQMQIGNLTTAREFNGTIKKLAYYPVRVTNAQLQALTS